MKTLSDSKNPDQRRPKILETGGSFDAVDRIALLTLRFNSITAVNRKTIHRHQPTPYGLPVGRWGQLPSRAPLAAHPQRTRGRDGFVFNSAKSNGSRLKVRCQTFTGCEKGLEHSKKQHDGSRLDQTNLPVWLTGARSVPIQHVGILQGLSCKMRRETGHWSYPREGAFQVPDETHLSGIKTPRRPRSTLNWPSFSVLP